MILLTGPPAAGKNAVAEAIARKLDRCAVVDVDILRHMVISPHHAPWEGEEGRVQRELGVRNACALATSFTEAGFDVVVLDVLSNDTAKIHREILGRFGLRIVQLMPALEEIESRNRARPVLTEDEVRMLYEKQLRFTSHDEKIDNTSLSPAEVAARLLA